MMYGRPQIMAPPFGGNRRFLPPPTPFQRGYRGRPGTPGLVLPPIGGGPSKVMPADRISVPSLTHRMRPPTSRYIGPPAVEPLWGGYSYQGRFVPDYRYGYPRRSWDAYVGPGGRPPPQDFFQYKEGQRFRKNLPTRPSSPFLFGIVLKEIVAALHRIFLDPDGNIYPVLNDIIRPDVHDLSLLIHNKEMDAQQEGVLSQDLQSIVENLIFHVTEIMPTDGVLGTHRKSAVFELISGGKRFPDGYFWQAEMDLLQFNQYMRTVNVKDAEAFLLFLGIFISRSLITTILLKPKDYGLSAQPLSDVAERNLRVVATALLTLIRRMASTRLKGVMDLPREIAKYLYTDKEMEFVNRRLDRAYNFCEGLLREWGTEYIRRLRACAPGY